MEMIPSPCKAASNTMKTLVISTAVRLLTAAQLLAIAGTGQDVPGLMLSHKATSDFALSADPESAHWKKRDRGYRRHGSLRKALARSSH
jgi:hypothetical protein